MNSEFDECLRKNKIRKFSAGKSLVEKELKSAVQDLREAEDSIKAGKYKWATVQAYYSMFHSGRTLLYAKNYREKSHYCLVVALQALYVEKCKFPISLVEQMQRARRLREGADYYAEWSEIGAKETVAGAKAFLTATKKLLKD